MSIWTFPEIADVEFPKKVWGIVSTSGDEIGIAVVNMWNHTKCPFCAIELVGFDHRKDAPLPFGNLMVPLGWDERKAFVCSSCGWWKAQRELVIGSNMGGYRYLYQGGATLKNLDLDDINTPISEVTDYLRVKYSSRFSMNPKLWEEVVADVFRNVGYSARVTGYSGDDGIDVILDDNDTTIGVQVKRYKDTIKVEQIRALVGALVLRGLTKGLFVTTSDFQRGAASTVERYSQKGYYVELMNSDRFLNALQITKREMYRSFEEFASMGHFEILPEIEVDGSPP